MAVQVDLLLDEALAHGEAPDARLVQAWVRRAAAAADVGAGVVAVRIVGDAEGRALNRQWRGVDRATNVLSFPAAEAPAELGDERPLGDVVICAPVVMREAREQGKLAAHHFAHLLVHGTLHLFGFDHEAEDEARIMEALETRLLGRGGIADPYAAAPPVPPDAPGELSERRKAAHE